MIYKALLITLFTAMITGCINLPTCDGKNKRPVNQAPLSVTCHHPSCKNLIENH